MQAFEEMYTGKMVRLRAFRKSDTQRAWSFMSDSEIKTYLITRPPFPDTWEDENKWVDAQSAYHADCTYQFAIETLADALYIGNCGIKEVNWAARWADLLILIGDHNYWNKGYGTDAMRILLRFCFEQMNLHKVKLQVYSLNPRAIRSYEKVGFVKESIMRQELYRNGSYHDVICMGLLREEWQR